MTDNVIPYTRELDRRIRNAESLPAGLNCRFLLCLKGVGDGLVAKAWLRKRPKALGPVEVLVTFGK